MQAAGSELDQPQAQQGLVEQATDKRCDQHKHDLQAAIIGLVQVQGYYGNRYQRPHPGHVVGSAQHACDPAKLEAGDIEQRTGLALAQSEVADVADATLAESIATGLVATESIAAESITKGRSNR